MKHLIEEWGFESWGIPSCQLTCPPLLDEGDKERYETLLHFEIPGLKVLISDATLFEAAIIHAWSRGGR